MGGTIFGDGEKGKNFVELDDYKSITTKIEDVWEGYGERHNRKGDKDPVNISYDLVIENEENINYLIELLKQRYDSIIKN